MKSKENKNFFFGRSTTKGKLQLHNQNCSATKNFWKPLDSTVQVTVLSLIFRAEHFLEKSLVVDPFETKPSFSFIDLLRSLMLTERYLKCLWSKNNCCLFERLFRVKKNSVFPFWNIFFRFRDIYVFVLCICIMMTS